MKKIIIAFILFAFSVQAELLQNKNWRFPYYKIATEMGYSGNVSPSGMFWDGIGAVNVYDSSLWPDSGKLKRNHLFIEPAINTGFSTDVPDTQDLGFYQVSLLNSITYKNIYLRQTLNIDKRYEYDEYYPAHKERAARGRIEEAFLQVNWKYGFFRLGRMERNWGPFSDRSLILSSNPYTYDAFEWQVHSSLFEFRHLFAAFPSEKSSWDTDGRTINRYLTAHSLNLILGKWMTLGLLESVLFTRDKGFPDLSYVNPFSIYTVINTNQEGVGNLMLGVQWIIHPFIEDISLRGQILWDDFQVDNEIATDKEPTHWGMDMGIYWRNPVKLPYKNSFKLEYNMRSKWLYTVPDNNAAIGERYTYLSKSLGASENDCYRISGGMDLVGKKYWVATVSTGYEVKGGNTPCSHWNDNTHTPGLPFDPFSLPEEKKVDFGLSMLFYFKDYVDLRFLFTNNWIKNKDNIRTEDYDYDPSIKAELSVHFSDLIIKLPE